MADSIRKRGIFDSVSVARHNGNPASFTTEDYEFIIFLDVDGWYIRMKDKARPISLPIDKSKPVGAPRVLSFLDVLYQQVTALRAK